jgi:hypothetical protein
MKQSFARLLAAGLLFAAVTAGSTLPACSGGTGGGVPDAGGPTDSGLNCAGYCAALKAACTGPNQQFSTNDRCINACGTYPVGAASDTMGDTLGCRLHELEAAAADPSTHCVNAGPGGDGVCGTNCDGYCQIAQAFCTAANNAEIYPDASVCQTHCAKFPQTVKYSVADDAGSHFGADVACLLYHVQEATTAPMEHCIGDLTNVGGPSTFTCSQ